MYQLFDGKTYELDAWVGNRLGVQSTPVKGFKACYSDFASGAWTNHWRLALVWVNNGWRHESGRLGSCGDSRAQTGIRWGYCWMSRTRR